MIVSRELHELRARDMLGEIAPLLDTRHAVTAPVHHEGRNVNCRQDVTDVDLRLEPKNGQRSPRTRCQPEVARERPPRFVVVGDARVGQVQ